MAGMFGKSIPKVEDVLNELEMRLERKLDGWILKNLRCHAKGFGFYSAWS